ncbi:MAG: M20 family metallo-hydrolase [Alphaproteobacteria bacterium]|nr:M20 family metallo-hydrolase [Alphaproteobacteria bacterium]
MLERILAHLDAQKQTVIDVQRALVAVPALSPENGGTGESEKAEVLKKLLTSIGLSEIKDIPSPDPRVPSGNRPNLAAVIRGRDRTRTLWVVSHIDVVPPGDLSLWTTRPFELTVDGDTLIGRGVEDDHHGIVSSFLLAKALIDERTDPPVNYGMLFVSDEESGNRHGIEHVVKNHRNLFGPNDMFLIPDYGNTTSEPVDIAEKGVLWLKISVTGKQSHSSQPQEGCNALTAAAALILKLRELHDLFDKQDPLFDPPQSTFEATKMQETPGSINILPGRTVFHMDCRTLPDYALTDVLKEIRIMGGAVEKTHGVKVDIETVQSTQAAAPTPQGSELIERLLPAIGTVYGNAPKLVGVGCFTVACSLRHAGYPAAAWASFNETPHKPNERSSIALTVNDAKVIARTLFA